MYKLDLQNDEIIESLVIAWKETAAHQNFPNWLLHLILIFISSHLNEMIKLNKLHILVLGDENIAEKSKVHQCQNQNYSDGDEIIDGLMNSVHLSPDFTS